ncbi:alpha/beta-hydrolase [Xylariaceae sp. FL0662B]|nr:alpha/beta-hydrolase [Xylariaceae sp. FL0662B]
MHPYPYFSLLLSCVLGSALITAKDGNPRITTSTVIDGASISCNKVPAEICGKVDSYAGYVNFPPNSMNETSHDYPVNTFYWYFPAQNNSQDSPLIIWLNGGPGGSSLFGLFTENGPCKINSNITPEANNCSWNKDYNVLYVDQPVQTGFSYDVPTEGFLNLETGDIIPLNSGEANNTLIPGVFSSQNVANTANTTENAARHFWNFLQVWSQDFPEYNSSDNSIGIWTESYGGRYGPSFAAFIHSKNSQIQNGSLPGANFLNLTSLGIINGCVDLLIQETSGPEFAYDRNDYGISGLDRNEYAGALVAFWQKEGCRDKILQCLHLGETQDPGMYGNATVVNQACKEAIDFCQDEVEGPYLYRKQWAFYDIAHCYLDAFPGNEFLDYLADEKVREALGVPVNYTEISNTVGRAFNLTGDYARRNPEGYLENIATLLDSGIQVAMIHGDRDFACNWIGGERVSLGVNYAAKDEFRLAGYANVTIDGPDPVGHVRQHGLFSFTRVFQSGHMVPSYQPKVAYHILHRAMQGKDIATGEFDANGDFSTDGPFNSTATLIAPPVPSVTCYLRGLPSTCAENQIKAVKDGTAVIENGVIKQPEAPSGTCPNLPNGFYVENQDRTENGGHITSWDNGEEL